MSGDDIAEVQKLVRLAKAEYEAMYEVRRHNVKDCFKDAAGYFRQAIDAAQRAGLATTAERLTRWREHVTNVNNSQFRYI